MASLKFGWYALLVEISAWTMLFTADGDSDAHLSAFLLLHLFASILLAVCAAALLPTGNARQKFWLMLLMAGCCYGVPIAGFIGVAVGTLLLRLYRAPPPRQVFDSLQLPDFDPHQRHQAGFRQSGLRAFLGNSAVPINARIGAMTALQYVSGRVSSPLLRDVLSDPSEDVRLLAYGMLDNQEKRINRAIDEELRRHAVLHQSGPASAREIQENQQHLSDLYWELVYQDLAQGDLRDYAIAESRRYCEAVLSKDPDNAPLLLRLGRLLHESGDGVAAEAAYRQARTLGLPATRVLPYQAELCFERGDYQATRALMTELSSWGALPRLRPIIDYWTAKR
jgi:hypothetical protein